MDDSVVEQVRRFSRTVTQRVGALNDHYLSRDRPLGEARVLWEIGADGCEVRELRARLDLDAGYLSRLLRALEADDLVTVEPTADDRRVRTARLTRRGRSERAVLDRRSDALARSLLEPLREPQQQRLVNAMGEVERLLTAALVDIDAVDTESADAQHCLRAYFAELDDRFDTGFDEHAALPTDAKVLLVARLRAEAIGCGALKWPTGKVPEIKRMWVAPSARGLGVGRRLLGELETRARADGARRIRLDTNATLVEAIAMYRASGYREIPAYNDEPHASLWFEKRFA